MMLFRLVCVLFVPLAAYHQIVNELEDYVNSNATFAKLLNETFLEASPNGNITYTEMYIFFDSWITIIEDYYNSTFEETIYKFGSTPTGSKLYVEQKSQSWIMKYFMQKKNFADSYNSTYIIPDWEEWRKINMSEYVIPPDGFQSFNDFFTRKLQPGLRPIASPNNDSVVVSPCDGEIEWIEHNLTLNNSFNIKNNKYDLSETLNHNDYFINKFIGGTAIQIQLEQYMYHRYHSAVSGFINEIDKIFGYILVEPQAVNQSLSIPCFEVNNNVRGIMYINNANIGYVAEIVVGVYNICSINFNVSPGIYVNKGDEVGYFAYGGSTIVLFFEKDVINYMNVRLGQFVQVGQAIATATSSMQT